MQKASTRRLLTTMASTSITCDDAAPVGENWVFMEFIVSNWLEHEIFTMAEGMNAYQNAYALTMPSNHMTTRIAAMVNNMEPSRKG